jgi:hypothetical protein
MLTLSQKITLVELCSLPDKVSELEKLWNVDDGGKEKGRHQIAPRAFLEGTHGGAAAAPAAAGTGALALVNKKRVAHGEVPANRKCCM